MLIFGADEYGKAQWATIGQTAHIEIVDFTLPKLAKQFEAPHRPHGMIEKLETMPAAPQRVPENRRPLRLLRVQPVEISEDVRPDRQRVDTKCLLVRQQPEPPHQLFSQRQGHSEIPEARAHGVLVMLLRKVKDHGVRPGTRPCSW